MNVKRYWTTCEDGIHGLDLAPEGKGTWVRYENYAALSALCQQQHEALEKSEAENVALRAKVQQIIDWCEAYPLDVFTEPDMVEVRKLLGDTLLTQLSAHNFRHVIDGVKQIAARGREGESEVQP